MKHIPTDLVLSLSKKLQPRYPHDPTLPTQVAWWLLEALTKKQKAALLTRNIIELSQEQENVLTSWLEQLIKENKPLQYILGSVPFCGLTIAVEPPTLIPRPETEEWVINLTQQLHTLEDQQLTILELCTGSGCIALALAHALPSAHLTATDIEKRALILAQNNAHKNNLSNVSFVQSDVYAELPTTLQAHCIVANPPYIAEHEWPTLDASVTEWEDKKALIADDEGQAIIKKIIDGAPQHLMPHEEMKAKNIPQLSIEIGHEQGATVKKLMEQAGAYNVTVVKDLAGKDRVVTGRFT